MRGNDTWPDLWRQIWGRHAKTGLTEWDRGESADKGVRLAVLRIMYRLELMDEPTPGAPLTELLWRAAPEAPA
jgi:hypothetical protein